MFSIFFSAIRLAGIESWIDFKQFLLGLCRFSNSSGTVGATLRPENISALNIDNHFCVNSSNSGGSVHRLESLMHSARSAGRVTRIHISVGAY